MIKNAGHKDHDRSHQLSWSKIIFRAITRDTNNSYLRNIFPGWISNLTRSDYIRNEYKNLTIRNKYNLKIFARYEQLFRSLDRLFRFAQFIHLSSTLVYLKYIFDIQRVLVCRDD